MMILQRKEGESLLIGNDIEVTVLGVEAGRTRLAIQAPEDVTILRGKLKEDVIVNSGTNYLCKTWK